MLAWAGTRELSPLKPPVERACPCSPLVKFNGEERKKFEGNALREAARKKILHYRQLYINRPDPIAFLPAAVDTTGRLYDEISRLLFLGVDFEETCSHEDFHTS
jgi:hypothetical protein